MLAKALLPVIGSLVGLPTVTVREAEANRTRVFPELSSHTNATQPALSSFNANPAEADTSNVGLPSIVADTTATSSSFSVVTYYHIL